MAMPMGTPTATATTETMSIFEWKAGICSFAEHIDSTTIITTEWSAHFVMELLLCGPDQNWLSNLDARKGVCLGASH